MRLSASLLLGLGLTVLLAGAAAAADRKCLSPEERRAVLAAHKAVPLAQAMHVKARLRGEVVKARLCRQQPGLVYVLTVLARDGKVTQARVDAADGHWLEGSGG